MPYALLFWSNGVGEGGQSRHGHGCEIGMKRLFVRVTDMMHQRGVDLHSQIAFHSSAAVKTSRYMMTCMGRLEANIWDLIVPSRAGVAP